MIVIAHLLLLPPIMNQFVGLQRQCDVCRITETILLFAKSSQLETESVLESDSYGYISILHSYEISHVQATAEKAWTSKKFSQNILQRGFEHCAKLYLTLCEGCYQSKEARARPWICYVLPHSTIYSQNI